MLVSSTPQMLKNLIVDRSTARDFTVCTYLQDETSAKWEMVENGLPDNESPFRLLV